MKLFYLFSFLIPFMAIAVFENWLREVARYSQNADEAQNASRNWHIVQFSGWFLVIAFALVSTIGISVLAIKLLIFISAMWWLLFDGLLNVLRGKSFFARGALTSDPLEKFANPVIKIILAIISLLILFV